MGQTYLATATAVAWSTANKVLLSLFNGSGSGRIVRIRRIWVLGNRVTTNTGILQQYSLYKLTTDTNTGTPTTITPVKVDTNSENLPAAIVCRTANTVNGTATLLRRFYWSGDEASAGALTLDELQAVPSLNCIWDVGYGNPDVQPLTLREGEGISLYQAALASSTGDVDITIEFTSDAT